MPKVKLPDLERFITDCAVAAGSPRGPAEQLAALLLAADKCGHRSHGLSRLERYILDITSGRCKPDNMPKILKETPATAWVDGNNVLGATAAHFGTDLALKKARETGIACVSVKGSNHFGIGGFWSKKLADNGMIGMTFTNGSPLVAPTRSTKAAVGTNPIAIVAPGMPSTGPFYLDISMATVALGKIEMCKRRGVKLEPGWAQGPDGKETLDPEVAMKDGCLMPLGGPEKSGGYKGFGLAAFVDIISGALAGALYGHHVPRWTPKTKVVANIGQTFIAINHKSFADGFEERVSDNIQYWRRLTPADPKMPVIAPGDIEKNSTAYTESSGHVLYIPAMIKACDKLARRLKVEPIIRTEQE